MSAARAKRRLWRHERYRYRALLLGARPGMIADKSWAHSTARWLAAYVNRPWWRQNGGRDPWTLSAPVRRSSPP